MRKHFVMSAEDRATILEACRPVPYMLILGAAPVSQQERANTAWKALGARMGFDGMTVRPVPGQPDTVFTAEEAPVSVVVALPVQMLRQEPPAVATPDAWQPIATAPEGELVVVFYLEPEDTTYPERHEFDYLEDGVWQKHAEDREHFLMVAPPGSTGPKETAPYTHWKRLGAPAYVRPAALPAYAAAAGALLDGESLEQGDAA